MSFSDWGSDLTDLSSSESDLDYVPASQKNKKKATKAKLPEKQQTVEGALRPPRTTQYTTRSLYEQIIEGSIDLDPEYQRDVVWPETKQIGLIDSIFRNFYIPPVIFSVIVGHDGAENRVCIDGKQRLTSLQKFMDGLIPYKDYATGKKYWYKQVGSSRGRTPLAKHLQQIFSNKQIVCMEYDGLNDDQEREMFQRVQLGVALTPAERMQAITGPWPTFVRRLRDNIDTDVFNDLSDFGKTRGRDFQAVVSVVFMIDKMPTLTTPAANALEKWLQQTTLPPKKLQDDVDSTFQVLVRMVQDSKLKLPFMKPSRISPVEFVMAGLLIYKHRNELSLVQISSAIEKMRANVREVEKDIRTNTRVTRLLFNFIKKLKTSSLKSDGKGDKPAALALGSPFVRPVKLTSTPAGPSKTSSTSAAPSKSTSTTTKKRKRVVQSSNSSSSSDDEDADLRPPPPKTSSKTRMTMNSRAALLMDMEPPKPKWTAKPKPAAAKAPPAAPPSKPVKSPVLSPTSSAAPAKPPVSAKKPVPSPTTQVRNTQTARPSRPLPPPINTQVPAAPSTKSASTPRNRRQILSPDPAPEPAPSPAMPAPAVVPKLERNAAPAEPPVVIKQEAEPISLSSLPPRPNGPSRLAALRAAKAAKAQGNSPAASPITPVMAQGMQGLSPGQTSMPSPAQTSMPNPAQMSVQSPAQMSMQSPAQMSMQSPAQTSMPSPAQTGMQSPAQPYQNQPPTPNILSPNLSRKPSPPSTAAQANPARQEAPPPSPMVGIQPTYTQTPSPAINQTFTQAGQMPPSQMVSPQTPQNTMTPQSLDALLRAVGVSAQGIPASTSPNAQTQTLNAQNQASQTPVNGISSGPAAANGAYPQSSGPPYTGNNVPGHHSLPTTPAMSNGSFPQTPAGLPPRPTPDSRLLRRTATAEGMRPPSPGHLRRVSTETAQSASPMSSFGDAHRQRSDPERYDERGRGHERHERGRGHERHERDREWDRERTYSRGRGYDYSVHSSSRGSYSHGGYHERERYEERPRAYEREPRDVDRRSSRGSAGEKGKERSRDSRYERGRTPEGEGAWGGGRRGSGGSAAMGGARGSER